jgi:Fe-S-cluster containining protein
MHAAMAENGAPTPRERLFEVFARVDAFHARVRARHPDALACRAGCDDCCHVQLTITALEASILRDHLRELPASTRDALAESARAPDEDRCPALDPDGGCRIYAARPLVCRAHGLPFRFQSPETDGKRSLPMIDACPKNFVGMALDALDPTLVLDQTTLSTILGALAAAHADAAGIPRGERVALAELLRNARD